ncbi:Gfo/Idh/MocA family oxidoreductase [Alisedimentitalea sp. MJ-SS2]|uniref:Gfo/Idh/MocA family protein n=1 Tax=Aliisedimentitalea sp. MJ-SS2 TaxID=3049795 RepID=UPI00290D2B9E|nr:Gfo/Idh/MocA family oxidoreductase [Alisedimentitalea sp. MJ-SS2]MDU8927063.1 Gfo/Idh/MocA family oxidoreductase [Alisedimentitalea sp. MJ-SS2]
MTAPLPIAVIGCGLIGLRHAQVAIASDDVELTAVVEPNADLRVVLNAQGLPVVPSLEEVPARTRAAIVATPTPDHAGAAIEALACRWAILVEKPISGTLEDADRMILAAGRAGLPLVTGHHRRCHSFVQATREQLARIGDPVAVQGMWSLRKDDAYFRPDWRRAPGSGPLMTNLSHELDLLRLFFGDITEVSALSSNTLRGHPIEDTSTVSIRFASGVLGSFLMSDAGASPWSFEAASDENPHIAFSGEDYIRISGTRGAIGFPSLTLWLGALGQEVNWHNPLVKQIGPKHESADPIATQMDLFAGLVSGRETGILATGEDGRAALEATLAAVLSAQTRQPIRMGDVPKEFSGLTA